MAHTNDNKENQSYKAQFTCTRFAIFEYHEETFIRVPNKNIYTGCLVPFFLSVEAEQYGERIMKIGWKIRKLCLIKVSYNLLLFIWRQLSLVTKRRYRKCFHMACFFSLVPWINITLFCCPHACAMRTPKRLIIEPVLIFDSLNVINNFTMEKKGTKIQSSHTLFFYQLKMHIYEAYYISSQIASH